MDHILPGSELGFVLGDAFRLWRQAFDRAIGSARLDLTPAEVRTLAHIVRAPGIRQSRLAGLMGLEVMSIAAHVQRLERLGFVSRESDPTDARARQILPQAPAFELFERLAPLVASVNASAVEGIDAAGRRELKARLERMRENLSEPRDGASG